MDFPEILVHAIPHAKVAVAAFFGGVVRMFLRPARSLPQTALLLISCTTCGYYGEPFVSHIMALPESIDTAVSALLGLLGVSLAQGALKAADKADLIGWFTRSKTP